jgi:hypothetical protein
MAKKDSVEAKSAPHPEPFHVCVQLKKSHTHAGIDYEPGDTITGMDRSSADWLVGEGVCEELLPRHRCSIIDAADSLVGA